MKRGRKPKPTALHLLHGTARAGRLNPHEPETVALAAVPEAPAWLDADGAAAWRELAAVLTVTRVLGRQDLAALATFADQIAIYRRADRVLRERGEVVVLTDGDGNPRGLQARPEVKIKQAAAAEIRRWCELFGITPSARSRVSAAPAETGPDPFEAFMRAAGGPRRPGRGA